MKIDGIPVVDATKPVRLVISKRDVLRGDTKDPATCAAALACMRQLRTTQVRVHIGRTYVRLGNKWVRFKTSEALRTEIIAFDRGGKFQPDVYLLTPMPPCERFGVRKKPRGPRTTKGKQRGIYHLVAGIRPHGANR